MATLATIIARQPYEFTQRYADSFWIDWINELLEKLGGEGFLMPSLDKEVGVVVANDVWITKPTGLRDVNKIWNPENSKMEYTFKEINKKIKLLNVEVEAEESPDTADAFQNYAVGSMDVDIDDAAEDDYEDFLLVIDGGTKEGLTIKIRNNDAAAAGYTKVYFYHDLDAILTDAMITSCYLTGTDYYVMLEGSFSYTDIADVSEEVPIDNLYEKRITKAWLRFKIEEATLATSKDTIYYSKQFDRVLLELKAERRRLTGRVQPRVMPGLDQYRDGSNSTSIRFADTDRY